MNKTVGNFSEIFKSMDGNLIKSWIYSSDSRDVERALSSETPALRDLAALVSPSAKSFARRLAAKSRELTVKHFGRCVWLYAPLYLSNECDNECLYCGFNKNSPLPRRTLSPSEIAAEADWLKSRGFDSVLLLTGESPARAGADYLSRAVSAVALKFNFVGLEVFPASTDVYGRFVDAGASGLTVYQETYDEEIYRRVHPSGAKKDFHMRLETPRRALDAGFRRVGLGALLGLSDWRVESIFLAAHAKCLADKYWRSDITLSFPRLRGCSSDFAPPSPASDADVAQMIFALRIFLPRASIVLSTRESRAFRDSMVGWGITMMSAASRTNPGGYSVDANSLEQFDVADTRSVAEVVEAVRKNGCFPVFKDWDRALAAANYEAQTC